MKNTSEKVIFCIFHLDSEQEIVTYGFFSLDLLQIPKNTHSSFLLKINEQISLYSIQALHGFIDID